MPHIWFKKHPDDKNGTKVRIEGRDIDLLYEFSFERLDATFKNCDEPMRTFNDYPKNYQETKKILKKIKRKKYN